MTSTMLETLELYTRDGKREAYFPRVAARFVRGVGGRGGKNVTGKEFVNTEPQDPTEKSHVLISGCSLR